MSFALAACSQDAEPTGEEESTAAETASYAEPGSADLLQPSGESVGTVSYREDANGVTVSVEVAGLEPGTHAVHLHETGDCSAEDFTSAGGHWNPTGAQHGRDNPQGAHLGDLANMTVDEDGSGSSNFLVTGATIGEGPRGMSDADGTALVIHAGADDYKTDPAGDAGDRVACAVVANPTS